MNNHAYDFDLMEKNKVFNYNPDDKKIEEEKKKKADEIEAKRKRLHKYVELCFLFLFIFSIAIDVKLAFEQEEITLDALTLSYNSLLGYILISVVVFVGYIIAKSNKKAAGYYGIGLGALMVMKVFLNIIDGALGAVLLYFSIKLLDFYHKHQK